MIRVAIADDHHLVRQGIRALLEKAEDIQVIGEAADGQEAVELVQRLPPDVLVIDIAMPRLNGIEGVRQIRALQGKTRTLVLSMYSDDVLVRQALRSGARGYLVKRALTEELLFAVRAVSRGEAFVSPEVAGHLLDGLVSQGRGDAEADLGPLAGLTSRERQVLQLIAEGNTNAAIAKSLTLSPKTVEKHRANLMAKLNAHDVAALTRLAVKHGLIRLDG
jgi:DNA-binding NarL/FixJ family response regulator